MIIKWLLTKAFSKAKFLIFYTIGIWFLYRVAMWLKKHRADIENKNKIVVVAVYAAFYVAYILDVIYNYGPGSLMFGRLPNLGDWTFSARLERIRNNPLDYSARQLALADFFCEKLLNPYDVKGKHC